MYCVMDREVVAGKDLLYGELIDGFWSPPCSMNNWTQHMHFYHIFLTDLFVNQYIL